VALSVPLKVRPCSSPVNVKSIQDERKKTSNSSNGTPGHFIIFCVTLFYVAACSLLTPRTWVVILTAALCGCPAGTMALAVLLKRQLLEKKKWHKASKDEV